MSGIFSDTPMENIEESHKIKKISWNNWLKMLKTSFIDTSRQFPQGQSTKLVIIFSFATRHQSWFFYQESALVFFMLISISFVMDFYSNYSHFLTHYVSSFMSQNSFFYIRPKISYKTKKINNCKGFTSCITFLVKIWNNLHGPF